MTHTTEQERAEFEAWYIAGARKAVPAFAEWSEIEIREGCMRPDSGSYRIDSARIAWDAWQAARRAPAVPVPQEVEKLRAELAEETEATDNWRRLALQFDNHRMQALWHLRAVVNADNSTLEAKVAEDFLKAPPLDGEAVLAQRIAALAAAPQPPEADMGIPISASAPAQLPEIDIDTANHAGIRVRGYTQETVLQLLADQQFKLDELAMLTRMVVHAFRKVAPDNKTAAKAVDYLKRKGLQGNPLRSLGIQEQRT